MGSGDKVETERQVKALKRKQEEELVLQRERKKQAEDEKLLSESTYELQLSQEETFGEETTESQYQFDDGDNLPLETTNPVTDSMAEALDLTTTDSNSRRNYMPITHTAAASLRFQNSATQTAVTCSAFLKRLDRCRSCPPRKGIPWYVQK